VEFIKPLYRKVIKASADFLCDFVDHTTGLPLPSYDLWEERLGVHTFTTCAVIAGLTAAAAFTAAFGETDLEEKYRAAASRMRDALETHLYDAALGRYVSGIALTSGVPRKQLSLDASLAGLFAFGVFPASDEKVASTLDALREKLWCQTQLGGMARYEQDRYQSVAAAGEDIPGNPWIICTLWYAQYLIEKATGGAELRASVAMLEWIAGRALRSGVLAEQINPFTGEAVSVSPLMWSHAEFIITVQRYLRKHREVERCPTCGQPLLPW
ncbi:MAG TPA: glycoside hydrolase family 15 protein, partial [Nitrospirota bacterium]|nr:glycoside hydrolase family 15 protein [Nitrospirota bacterium]